MKTKDIIIICSAALIVIVLFSMFALLIWLESENTGLKSRVGSLEEENAKLKETDQNYFSRGIDALKFADSKGGLQSALDIFEQLAAKFPQSPYLHETQQHISYIQKRIGNIERIEVAKIRFESALGSNNFSEASAALEILGGYIPDKGYKTLSARLYEEQNKPLEITINKLISDFGTYKSQRNMQNMYGMLNKRVIVYATFSWIDRSRKELRAYSDGWGKGSVISVFYDGTNMEGYFTDNDPKCCNNRYIITGITRYSNTYELYIKAEKIEVISH